MVKANRATPVGDGAIDDGSLREDIEHAHLRSAANPGDSLIPIAKQDPQFVAQLGEFAQAGVDLGEPISNQRADAPTWRTPRSTLGQHRREIMESEPIANARPPYTSQ